MRILQAPSYSMALHGSALAGLLALSALRVGALPEGEWRAPIGPLYLSVDPPGGGGDSALPASSRDPADRAVSGTRAMLRRDAAPAPREEPPPSEVPPPSQPDRIPEPDAALQNAAGDPNAGPAEASGSSVDASSGGGNGTSGEGGDGGDGSGDGTGHGPGNGPGDGAGAGPGGGGDEVLYLDGTITLPVVVRRVEPVYPPPARMARLEATLRFQVVVDEHGDVIEVTPIKSHPLFEQSAVEALRRWKYRPAMQGGRAVKVYLLVTVEFRLVG